MGRMREAGEEEVGQRTVGRAEERAERGRCCERTRRMSAMVQSQTSGCWIYTDTERGSVRLAGGGR